MLALTLTYFDIIGFGEPGTSIIASYSVSAYVVSEVKNIVTPLHIFTSDVPRAWCDTARNS